MGEQRGSIAFTAAYKPPMPLDIFSCPVPPSSRVDELHLTDGISSNYNCQVIPPAALKVITRVRRLITTSHKTIEAYIDSGHLTGLIFVSEREHDLETLHIALRFIDNPPNVKVFSLAEVYGTDSFSGVRMEDSGCIAGGYKDRSRTTDHFLIYVSTKEPMSDRHSPGTVVYKTNLRTGETECLTPPGAFDLSPSVSPSGKRIALASFQGRHWEGECEDLHTDIYVMDVDHQSPSGSRFEERKKVLENGGWPTWGSENVLFFHRKVEQFWRVFQFNISTGNTIPVTPGEFDAITPAAISETKVAVATIRMKPKFTDDVRADPLQFRHIEIFDTNEPGQSVQITQKLRPSTDHFNPFLIDGGQRIGYHRYNIGRVQNRVNGHNFLRSFNEHQSPLDNVRLFRVSGVFPTISKDGSKLAFINSELNQVWVADSQGLRIVYKARGPEINSICWNQNPERDILYCCMGPAFRSSSVSQIVGIPNVSSGAMQRRQLTKGKFNNAFPSTNPDGTKLVFRSTRDGGYDFYKNLYIMEDADSGEYGPGRVSRLTSGPWIDTHCQWSPRGDWIVFSSNRDKPYDAPEVLDYGLPGYLAVFLVKASDPSVVVRVIRCGFDGARFVDHPVFSPDGRSIVVTADLAAVSIDPVSLPHFHQSWRPSADLFSVDIDPDDIFKNEDLENVRRITHSRYENCVSTWAMFGSAQWHLQFLQR